MYQSFAAIKKATPIKKNEPYSAPEIDLLEMNVEAGFALSAGGTAPGYNEDDEQDDKGSWGDN